MRGSAPDSLSRKTEPALPRFTGHDHNDTILKEHAEVAQLVEQLIRNQQVVGSSPTFGSIKSIIYRDHPIGSEIRVTTGIPGSGQCARRARKAF